MMRLAFSAIIALSVGAASAQDVEYIRAVERAQQDRPARIESSPRIAPRGEPGTPMILNGRVLNADGTAAADTVVFAYHTDRHGVYDRPGSGAHSWRLKGWAKTDRDGRFTFETIRPGPYPKRDVPAHVHLALFTPTGERYHGGEVKFEDDPLLTQRERAESKQAGELGEVRAVRREGGAEHVEFTLRVDPSQRL